MKKKIQNLHPGFSVAELLLSLLVVMVVAVALAPIIGPKKLKVPRWHAPHGTFQCYYYLREGTPTLHQYSVIDGNVVDVDVAGSDHCTFENIPEASLYEVYAVGEGTDAVPEASLIEATGEMADMYYQEGMEHDTEYAQQSFQLFNSENNNAYDEESNPNGVQNIPLLDNIRAIRTAREPFKNQLVNSNINTLLQRLSGSESNGLFLNLENVLTPTAQPGMSLAVIQSVTCSRLMANSVDNYIANPDGSLHEEEFTPTDYNNLANVSLDSFQSLSNPADLSSRLSAACNSNGKFFLYLFKEGGSSGGHYQGTNNRIRIQPDQNIKNSVIADVYNEYHNENDDTDKFIRIVVPAGVNTFSVGSAESFITYNSPTQGGSPTFDDTTFSFTDDVPVDGSDGSCSATNAICEQRIGNQLSAVTAAEFYTERYPCPAPERAFCYGAIVPEGSEYAHAVNRVTNTQPGRVDIRPNAFGWAYRPLMSRVKIGGKGERGREGIYKGDRLRGPLLLFPQGVENARSRAVRVEGEAETIIAQAPETEVPADPFRHVEDTFNPSSNKPTEAQIDFADPHNEQLKYRYAIEGIGEPNRGVAGLCREHRCPGFGGGGYFPIFHYHAYALDSSATEFGDPQEYSPYLELILGDNVASTYAFFTTTLQGQRHILRDSLNIPEHDELYSDEDCGAGRSYMVDTAGGGRAHDICRIYSGDNPLYVNGHGLGAVIVVW